MATTAKDDIRTAKQKKTTDAVMKKFDESKIKQRKVPGGQTVDYVQAQEFIVKLNEIFGVAWSSEIVQHFLVNNQVVFWVRITYPNPDNPEQLFYKDGIDGHPLSGDVGNAFKSGYLKAFRKAAAQIGMGIHLWGIDVDGDDTPSWDNAPNSAPTVRTPSSVPTPPNAMVGGTGNPLPPGVAPPPPNIPVHQHQGGEHSPLPPQMYNNNPPGPPPSPPSGEMAPPPPVPTGNPNPGGPPVPAQNVGIAPTQPDGARGSASASVGIQGSGSGEDMAAGFQINGIRGAAVALGTGEIDLVRSILGQVADNIASLEQLTANQAQQVMDRARQMTQGR